MTSKQKIPGPLTLGLDIGIASVGWAVLGENRIIDLGVRCFDKAETAIEGESLNKARRDARLLRRRLRRRAWRLKKLARLLKREGLIADPRFFEKQIPAAKSLDSNTPLSPWKLRVDALERRLGDEEWARVIYHLCKHRGFHWLSRAEEAKADTDKKEGGKVKQGLAGTKRLMKEKGYRTAAEMVLTEFPDAQRNKQGDYSKALSRELLAAEFKQLFEKQRALGNPHASAALEEHILGAGDRKSGLFWKQKPALSGEELLKMVGKCTFEKSEYRAPKASFTVERHVWLTRLNNLRIVIDGKTRSLTPNEHTLVLTLPYMKASDFKYEQMRTALTKAGLTDNFRFSGLSYPSQQQIADKKAKDPEEETLIKLPAWQALRKTLKSADLEAEWQRISTDALEGKPQKLDNIAWVLSIYKEDDEVKQELGKLDLPNKEVMIDALLSCRFDKFSSLSLMALYKILPHMEQSLRFDEACENAGYHHSQLFKGGSGEHKYLPPFYSGREKDGRMVFTDDMDIPRNPVVLRALNQARKVVNALIKTYGSPYEVHIELARDLSKPFDERKRIEREQKDYREQNDKHRETFAGKFGFLPKGKEFEKWQLYGEQMCKCAYSLEALDIHRLFEDGYVEIDHALPYSRSFDDSKNNRVLVLTRENRNKGNSTPFEYLNGNSNSERWREFSAFVETNKMYRQAKRNRLLRKDFGTKESEEFRERNLNDTRYICRFFKNYVERYLKLHTDSDAKRCVVASGQLTSFLRARWGLIKVRGDSDRHHALDAAVVAACSHGMVKRLSDYSRRKELAEVRDGFVDVETGEVMNPAMLEKLEAHFPAPWTNFRDELLARLNIDDATQLRSELGCLDSYPVESLSTVRPIFVSRAPQRRNGGAMHEATLRSPKLLETGESYVRVALEKLNLKQLDRIVGAEDPRNHKLIETLRSRLQTHDGDGKKAFSTPLFKPSADGKMAPVVRTVKLRTTQNTGAVIGRSIADLGTMLHVDVFFREKRYYVIPTYAIPDEKRVNPIVPPLGAEFLFSLAKNDFLEVTIGSETLRGYFVMFESDGRLTLRAHDQPRADKAYFRKSVSSATRLLKFHVDVLGNIYPAPKEQRRELA